MTADDPVLEVRDVWRRYRLSSTGRSATLRGSLAGGRSSFRRDWFWALRGVDLTVERGEAVGVIGPNGAGKSTLLRVVGGIGRPDRGRVRRRGEVSAMLDLGRELHPDLTGRENAELAAIVAGLTRAEFRRRLGAMLDFAGLDGFVDEPLHAYSDGMRARLAFSVLAHVDPDLLLVDEVLAVGDHAFQQRCIQRIEALRNGGVAVLFVSHDLQSVQQVCTRALWLEGGIADRHGDPSAVVKAYVEAATTPQERPPTSAAIEAVTLRDPWGGPLTSLRPGQALRVSWQASADPEGRRRRTSLVVRRAGHQDVIVDTSAPLTAQAEAFAVTFDRLDLAAGPYEVVVSLYDEGWAECLGWEAVPLTVEGVVPASAVLAPPHEWSRQRR